MEPKWDRQLQSKYDPKERSVWVDLPNLILQILAFPFALTFGLISILSWKLSIKALLEVQMANVLTLILLCNQYITSRVSERFMGPPYARLMLPSVFCCNNMQRVIGTCSAVPTCVRDIQFSVIIQCLPTIRFFALRAEY